jgi:hypothetical protein
MKQLWLAGLFGILLFSSAAFADVVTGSELKNWIDIDANGTAASSEGSKQDWFARYRLLGFIEGVSGAMWVDGKTCYLPSPAQVIQATKNFLEAHPEQWGMPAALIVSTAITNTFPCNTKKKGNKK